MHCWVLVAKTYNTPFVKISHQIDILSGLRRLVRAFHCCRVSEMTKGLKHCIRSCRQTINIFVCLLLWRLPWQQVSSSFCKLLKKPKLVNHRFLLFCWKNPLSYLTSLVISEKQLSSRHCVISRKAFFFFHLNKILLETFSQTFLFEMTHWIMYVYKRSK